MSIQALFNPLCPAFGSRQITPLRLLFPESAYSAWMLRVSHLARPGRYSDRRVKLVSSSTAMNAVHVRLVRVHAPMAASLSLRMGIQSCATCVRVERCA